MSRQPRRRISGGSDKEVVSVTDENFARRLYSLMLDKGWTQSDLARHAFGQKVDERTGSKVALGRDRISMYINGRSVPDPKNLKKLADAFGMTTEELAPDLASPAIQREAPELAITQSSANPEMVVLRVNKIVTPQIANKVFQILCGDD